MRCSASSPWRGSGHDERLQPHGLKGLKVLLPHGLKGLAIQPAFAGWQ